jgi:N6-L-threonylcarbamoyladenine synthase
MKVLGIESSADDSGVALIEAFGEFGKEFGFSVHMSEVASQQHAEYGGIFPNVAKNEHIKNLPLLLEKLPKGEKPDVIAVTVGPGLEPCLWAGINVAQRLSDEWHIPVVGVNHLEGHIIMSMVEDDKLANIEFPMLSLLISGGNTQLVISKQPFHYSILGKTRDDAAGEAFDKVGRMLGLPYPSGPEISRLAALARAEGVTLAKVSPSVPRLPRPMLHENNYDFSFSGLKTAANKLIESLQGDTLQARSHLGEREKQAVALELEEAIADVLVGKTLRAVEEYGVGTVVTGGGVSANTFIRARLEAALETAGSRLHVCPPKLSTDNGLMIALPGYFHALKKEFTDPRSLSANGALTLEMRA